MYRLRASSSSHDASASTSRSSALPSISRTPLLGVA
jgi:hypothetical protein